MKVQEILRAALVEILQRGLTKEPILDNSMITITYVDVTPDLKHAKFIFLPFDEEKKDDDFAKMVNANILDYLRNVHRLEVQDVSQRDAEAYQLLLEFENQIISIQVSRDQEAEQRREGVSSPEVSS